MPQTFDRPGFWAGGSRRHIEALKEAEAEELAALGSRLADASPSERAEIELEMKGVREKYRSESRSSAQSLFSIAGVSSTRERAE